MSAIPTPTARRVSGPVGERPSSSRLRTGLTAFALALLTVWGTAPGAAQEAGGERPGWLGVGILQGARCDSMPDAWDEDDSTPRENCRRVVVVDAVIDGSPAARAGIEAGDTLVAVNGEPLHRESGRRELVSLRPGEPAEVTLGREEGRVSFRVVPVPRPPRAGPVPVSLADSTGPGSPVLVRLRGLTTAEPPAAAEREIPPVEVVGSGGGRTASIRMGEDGSVYLVRSDGESVLVHRLRKAGPRLREIQDSVFAEARQRIRALREHQRELARLRTEGSGRGEVAAPGRLRAAGAEFRTLEGSLAEYFPAAEQGLLVLQVVPRTPAASLGLRPGDVVVDAAGRPVAGPADFRAALSEFSRRDTVRVGWIRRGERMSGALTHP